MVILHYPPGQSIMLCPNAYAENKVVIAHLVRVIGRRPIRLANESSSRRGRPL